MGIGCGSGTRGHRGAEFPALARARPAARPLTAPELAAALFAAPFVLVSHDTQADPVLNYGNAAALTLWEMSWAELTGTPSRLTAEPVAREERARLLAQVTRHGHIADYAGVRIAKSGRRFRIAQARVWNLRDEAGAHCGQAAMFDHWEYL